MVQSARAVETGTLDPTFADGGVLRFPIPEISGFNTEAVLPLPGNKLLVAILLLGVDAPVALARLNEDGSLDLGFGGNGSGLVEISLDDHYFDSVKELRGLSDGGWLVFGQYRKGSWGGKYVVRHNRDGQPDMSFGEKGVLLIRDGRPRDAGIRTQAFDRDSEISSTGAPRVTGSESASAVQQDGKILLVSYVRGAGYSKQAVLRLNPDGTTDHTFNGTGFAPIELGGIPHEWNIVEAIAVQADGKVLVSGEFAQENPYARVAYVLRLDASGQLDTSFNGGMVTVRNTAPISVKGISIREADGTIVVVGEASVNSVPHGLMFVLTSGGFFDFNFNRGQPLFSLLVPQGLMWSRSSLRADGSILVAGSTGPGYVEERLTALTALFRPDGSLDPSFNGTGFTVFDEEGRYESVTDMKVMADGRFVVCGFAWVDGDPSAYIGGGWVIRYLA